MAWGLFLTVTVQVLLGALVVALCVVIIGTAVSSVRERRRDADLVGRELELRQREARVLGGEVTR